LEHVLLNAMNISSPSLHEISHSCSNLHYVSIHGYDFKYSKQWQTSAIYPKPISLRLLQSIRVSFFRWIAFVAMVLMSSSLMSVCDRSNAVSFD
jgi:hypothetical protein